MATQDRRQARRPNPRGQGGRLRDELLDAASGLLAVGGRDAELTLRSVARAAGVAAPSVYQHFADLDELMLALVRYHLADLAAAIDAALAPVAGQPATEQLEVMAHAYVRWGLDHPGPYTVVFEGKVLRHLTREQEAALLAGPVLAEGDDPLSTPAGLFERLARLTATATGAGNPQLTATALWTCLHGLVALRIAKPAYPWPPLDEHVGAVLSPAWQG
ncbi:MAG TPA: WHG domain-containing protein [Streptosporangiaceae bacterium]|nr:WHG domain-containing protein [Streptosporangiaceae bacterium]